MRNLSKILKKVGAVFICGMMIGAVMVPMSYGSTVPPSLVFESPDHLQPIVQRLQRVGPKQFVDIMSLLGLEEAGPLIRVMLATNESDLAREVPDWVVGYAVGRASTVVLLTDRVANYPYDSLEGVLLHEVGHILTYRAAGGYPVPRWFDESLAMMAARTWNLEERARLVWAMVSGSQVSFDELNDWFVADGPSARSAYVIAHAMTRDLLDRTTPDVPKRLLGKVASGVPFPEAFAQTTFMTLEHAEATFWKQQTLWNRWIPVATSSGMLWLAITALVFFVARKQRKRTAAIQKRWEEEEDDL